PVYHCLSIDAPTPRVRTLSLHDALPILPGGRVGDDLPDVVPGVEPAVRAPVEPGAAPRADLALPPPRAHLGQPRVALDLQPPPLVVGQVEVEHVELVHGHQVDEAQHPVLGHEVPGDVEHAPPPAEPRPVGDVHAGQRP